MQTVILEKTINVEVNIDFPKYFKILSREEYYMFPDAGRCLSVEIINRSAYINCSTSLVEMQLQACFANCIQIDQQTFIEGYKAAEDIIRNEITNACKMEVV